MKLKDFILENYTKYDDRKEFIKDAMKICGVTKQTVYNRLCELKIIFKNDKRTYKKQKDENIDPHIDLITFYKNKIVNHILKTCGWLTEKELRLKLKINKHNTYTWHNLKKEIEDFKINLNKNIYIYVHPSIKKDILKIKKEMENLNE